MDAGKLNRRIQIQSQVASTALDAFQQPTAASWQTVYACWANIDVQQSQLIYSTAEFISKVTHRITIRWTSSVVISPKQRIVYKEPATGVIHIYEIQAVINDKQANRMLIMMAHELDAKE